MTSPSLLSPVRSMISSFDSAVGGRRGVMRSVGCLPLDSEMEHKGARSKFAPGQGDAPCRVLCRLRIFPRSFLLKSVDSLSSPSGVTPFSRGMVP